MEPRPENYQNIFWDFVTNQHEYPVTNGRKVSILELMKELQFSTDELSVLAKAKILSDNLIKQELQAFNAMDGRFRADDGQYSLVAEPDPDLARQIVHGPAYHQAKAKIMAKVNEFFLLVESRTSHEVKAKEALQQQIFILASILSMLLILFSISGYFYFSKGIAIPLRRILGWVKRMQKGEYNFKDTIRRNDEIGSLNHAFVGMAKTVSNNIVELERVSRTDQLTQISNRIALDEVLQKEKYNFERYHTDCSIILLDIDNFKEVNDRYGHITGDKVLIEMAKIIQKSLRQSDIVGRWGGEEFLIICPNTDIENSRIVAESIRKNISEFLFSEVGHRTASLGTSSFEQGVAIEATIDRADCALYQAKKHGRNCVF